MKDRPDLLYELARVRSRAVRVWVTWAAPQVLADRSTDLLLRMATTDHNSDVRSFARQEVVRIDPSLEIRFVPQLLSALRREPSPFGEAGERLKKTRVAVIWCRAHGVSTSGEVRRKS